MTFETGLLLVAGILAIAGVLIVVRIITGPTILDRAVGSDMLVVLMVMALAVYTASSRTTYAAAAMLSLTGLSFMASVAVARFVSREDASGTRRPGAARSDARGDHRAAISAPGEAVLDEHAAADDAERGADSAREIGTETPLDAERSEHDDRR